MCMYVYLSSHVTTNPWKCVCSKFRFYLVFESLQHLTSMLWKSSSMFANITGYPLVRLVQTQRGKSPFLKKVKVQEYYLWYKLFYDILTVPKPKVQRRSHGTSCSKLHWWARQLIFKHILCKHTAIFFFATNNVRSFCNAWAPQIFGQKY